MHLLPLESASINALTERFPLSPSSAKVINAAIAQVKAVSEGNVSEADVSRAK